MPSLPAPGETLDDGARARSEPPVRREPQLVVALECDRLSGGGARHGLGSVTSVALGRGSERTVTRQGGTLALRFAAPSMSASHAQLVRHEGAWWLEDLGSRNGSWVNGARVERAPLREGDLVELGRVFFVFHEGVLVQHDAPEDVVAEGGSTGLTTLIPDLALRFEALRRIAPTTVPVLLLGETGTGKEVVARELHQLSGRSGAFVGVNCGALPKDLVEPQLFGHVRGAFSGAVRDEPGFFRAAHHGTLLLDEIGDLPLAAQVALLRVLQEGEVVPVGSTRPVTVDVRIVAATHRALGDRVESGGFRSDLFGRLAGFTLELPPLAERLDDFGVIVASLLGSSAGPRIDGIRMSPDAGRALLSYAWPRNIRELSQALAAACALADDEIVAAQLPAAIASHAPPTRESARPSSPSIAPEGQTQRAELVEQLRTHGGNVTRVAQAMGKAPMQVYRWMRRFGLDPRDFR